MSDIASNNEINLKFYKPLVKKYGSDHRAVGWKNRYNQRIRFHTFCNEFNFFKKSVLDVGCGLGDFYHYLKSLKKDVKYTGIDACEQMIQTAKDAYPSGQFYTTWLEEYQTKIPFDSVVASGVFALRVPDQKNYFVRQLQCAYSLSRETLMANILTTETPKKEQFKCFYYYDPVDLLLLKKLTPSPKYINIITGYLKGDATIVIKR